MSSPRPKIPEPVKREVRRRCGFGCVICGLGYYDYHHLIPYHISKSHIPDELTLLCHHHHTEFERGRLSSRMILSSNKNPLAIQRGYASGVYESSDKPLEIVLGNNRFLDVPSIITVGDIPLIRFRRPIYEDEPWLMTAFMTDDLGQPMLTIHDNEWRADSNRWDITTEGSTLTIKNGLKNVGLQIRQEPGEKLVFEKAKIKFAGVHIKCTPSEMTIGSNKISGAYIQGGKVGMAFGLPSHLKSSLRLWARTVGKSYGFNLEDDQPDFKVITY